jgi:ankyrin repeat protein
MGATQSISFVDACYYGDTKTALKFTNDKNFDINLIHEMAGNSYRNCILTNLFRNKMKDILIAVINNPNFNINIKCLNNDTPLILACNHKLTVIALKILESEKCDVNVLNDDKENALMIASKNGMEDVVVRILDHDCNINYVDKNGFTPLELFSQCKMEKAIMRILQFKYCNINYSDRTGGNALMWMCYNEMENCALKLLSLNCDINQISSTKNTALLWACKNRLHNIIYKMLERNDCDIKTINSEMKCAFLIACENNMEDVALKLIDKKCKVTNIDKLSQTSLIHACNNKMENVALKILSHELPEAYINTRDSRGYNALELSLKNNMEKVTEFIVTYYGEQVEGKPSNIQHIQKENECCTICNEPNSEYYLLESCSHSMNIDAACLAKLNKKCPVCRQFNLSIKKIYMV